MISILLARRFNLQVGIAPGKAEVVEHHCAKRSGEPAAIKTCMGRTPGDGDGQAAHHGRQPEAWALRPQPWWRPRLPFTVQHDGRGLSRPGPGPFR